MLDAKDARSTDPAPPAPRPSNDEVVSERNGRRDIEVLVIGGGYAGFAAAWSANAAGASTAILESGGGASLLSLGALDWYDWHDADATGSASLLADERAVRSLLTVFPGFEHAKTSEALALLATVSGETRPTRVAHRALLNLRALPIGSRVAIPSAPGIYAEPLARALNESTIAREQQLLFSVIRSTLCKHRDEHDVSMLELAKRHDDPARQAFLLRELAAIAQSGHHACLLPPLLGTLPDTCPRLQAEAPLMIGELYGFTPSPMSLRYAAALGTALSNLAIPRIRAKVTALGFLGNRIVAETDSGARWSARAIVLATGGILGGGLRYTPAAAGDGREFPFQASAEFSLGLDGTVASALELRRRVHHARDFGPSETTRVEPSSLHGSDPEQLFDLSGRGPMLQIGVHCDQNGRAYLHDETVPETAGRVWVCGDAALGLPQSFSESAFGALASGLRAGASAAAFSVSA
jgi:glycerol-3-phosphate dehydrogenase subunit B